MSFSSPGLLWPFLPLAFSGQGLGTLTATTLNAAGLKLAFIGELFIYGGGTHTISSGGGGTIGLRVGGATWANAGSNIDWGLQGVSTANGPCAQPDGTFTVKKSIVPGTTAITANSFNTIAMGTGSASLTHGQLVAVVLDMTARAGADSVVITGQTGQGTGVFPIVTTHNGTSWATTGATGAPIVIITFDDNTKATIDGCVPYSTVTNEAFQASTNPNERGILFQVPADCYADALWTFVSATDGNSGLTMGLYNNPIGGQSSLATVATDPHNLGGTSIRFVLRKITPTLLRANSEYGVTVLATGTSNITMPAATPALIGDLQLWPGGSTTSSVLTFNNLLTKITRNGSSGNFATASLSYLAGVRLLPVFANQLVDSGALVA